MKPVSSTTKMFIWSLVLQLVFGIAPKGSLGDDRPTNPDVGPQTFELLSYQASEYRFLVIPADETPPSGFEQPDFDDSDIFSTGSAAFGSGGDCPLQQTVQTEWPVDSQLLVRRKVSIPAGATDVRVMVSIDNDIVSVFFNGTPIAENILHDECPILDEFRINVPQNLVQAGENLVVFHLRDRGVESFFDTRILAERDHLACYEVEEKDHKKDAKKVILHNQFEGGTKVYVGELKLLCVPTRKELDKNDGDKDDKK